MIEPETVIDGRYKVLSRIGSGGMADVYLAEDLLLGRQVAVKVLHHHFAEDQEFVERFRREASSAAKLSHQNIVGIFDRGEWNGTYYIAMEYVAGRSLKTIVREQGALDPALAIDIVVQILRAARSAHRRGVIHRDLKPHNVIVDEEGRARVTDFGIARAGASDMTLTGSIMGTAQYLSPEQAQGQPVDAPTDLYSVGVILYELLTGVVPFDGETAVAIAFKQVSAVPAPPSAVNPALPASLDAIVLRVLAKDPAQRYASADELIEALQRERQALPASAQAPLLAPAYAGVDGTSPAGTAATDTGGLRMSAAQAQYEDYGRGGGSRRTRLLIWGLVVAAVVAAVVLAIVLLPAAGRTRVPGVVGQAEQAAVTAVRKAGLTPDASQAASTTVSAGTVLAQTPREGKVVDKGTRVNIVVSSGPPSKALVNVASMSASEAVRRLRAAGFAPTTTTQSSATVTRGRVIATTPSAGTELQVGSPVTVIVSGGPAQVRVPDVVGESQAGAEAALSGAGLTVGTVTHKVANGQAPGDVLSQSPRAGTSLTAGHGVDLVLAQASTQVSVPNVVGQSEAQAAATLGAAGLAPKAVSKTIEEQAQVGVVLKQSPSAGRRARRGATVTIEIGALAPTTTSTTTTPAPTTPTTTNTATPAPAP